MDLIATFAEPMVENRRVRMSNGTLHVGRDLSSGLVLEHSSVSRKHALIRVVDGKSHFIFEDRKSSNGSSIDGMPVSGSVTLHSDQVVGIGPFRFRICPGPNGPEFNGQEQENHGSISDKEDRFVRQALGMLPELMETYSSKTLEDDQISMEMEKVLYPMVLKILPDGADPEYAGRITKRAIKQTLGLGPLEEWMKDPDINEIMVNGTESIYLERNGRMFREGPVFPSEHSILRIIEKITAPLGRRIDESSPYVDGRLPDGSRVNAVIPPVSLSGPILTIRKFSSKKLAFNDLVRIGTLTEDASELLKGAVHSGKNILVSGGTGTGKTTFLNALASFIDSGERVITIEDAAELDLDRDHVIRLETRPPNVEGKGEVTARDLVRNSLRMRPDRIIIGECRGAEALDMLQAMNTGHEGSMTTCHANTPRDSLKRIETMALMSSLDLPHSVIREQVASAIHLIVQLVRTGSGKRLVSHILEVDRMEGGQILTQDLFLLEGSSSRPTLKSTGLKPSWTNRKSEGSVPEDDYR